MFRMPCLIHEYEPHAGGLGDLFRSILSHFAMCRRETIPFYVSLEKVPHLQACFVCAKPETISTSTYTKRSIGDYDGTQSILETIQLIKALPTCAVRITSNGTIFHEKQLLQESIPFLFQNVLQPSLNVIGKLESIYLQHNIRPKQYVCVHIRTGDRVIELEQNGSQTSSDCRVRLEIETLHKFHRHIQIWKQNISNNLPIYILSDSISLRRSLLSLDPSYRTLDAQVQHVANGYGKNTEHSYCSTVMEFFFLQNAHTIYMPIYSGFSHIASVLGNCELATPIQTHSMFTHMGPPIIHHIPGNI